jgi:sugar O-acyltransferase (sialic acid O-acetyltransferase NeuD family)
MSKTKLILIGGGGHCKSCIDVIEGNGDFFIYGILDIKEKVGSAILGYQIMGDDDDIPRYAQEGYSFLITTGQISSSKIRRELFEVIKQAGGKLETIIAPTAHVSPHAAIGEGTIIMHHALVNAEAKVGNNCIINTSAVVEHDVVIGDNVHISTVAVVNGGCKINSDTFIGSNAVIAQGIEVASNCIIGAGSVVHRNIEEVGTYVGNPYKKIK